MSDSRILRRVERDVLDQHHRQYALLRRNKVTARVELLRCYAQILRDLRTGRISKPNDSAKSQTANDGLRGLAHCLRWIEQCCPSRLVVPTCAADLLANEALELLRWGVTYDPIWNQHSAYSRGFIQAAIDEPNKSITFLPRRNITPHFFCTQVEAKKAHDERLASARPDGHLAELSEAWYESVTCSGWEMRFNDSTIRASGAIDVASSWMENTCLPELSGGTNLMGCTVGELRRVLAALYVYSLFVTNLEDVGDDQPALGVAVQSRVVERRRDHMVEWLAGLSGVPTRSVEAIVSVLTFDHNHPHVTLAQQPLIDSDDGQLLFLPRMLLFLDMPYMYVAALNKNREGRKVYDERINEIESAGLKSLAGEIRSLIPSDVQMAVGRSFELPDGKQITPDIVIASQQDLAVLVIDLKFVTPPFGPADMARDCREFEKWRGRMGEYVFNFQNNPHVLSQHLQWTAAERASVFGLIVTRRPHPIPIDVTKSIGAVDWPSLRDYLGRASSASILELMTWAENRPDVTVPAALEWLEKDVKLGAWSYRYSVLVPPRGNASSS